MEKEKKSKINKKIIVFIVVICIIISILVITLVVNNNHQDSFEISDAQTSQSNALTEKSDNYLGMKFTFNIEQFEQAYLKTLKNNFSEYNNLLEKEQIDKKFQKTAGANNYEFNKTAYDEQNQLIKYFSIFLEPESKESNYIDFIQINAVTETSENVSKLAENNIFYAFMAIDGSISYEKAKNIYYEMNMSEKNYVSNENITFAFDIDSDIDCAIINIYPFNEQQYTEFINSLNNNEITAEDLYNDSTNINEEIVMPNLVGMNYADLRNYFDNNNLYFIQKISYRTDYNDNNSLDFILPTKILSTIPPAGTPLDPNKDTSITVYTDYTYAVRAFYIQYENEDWETKYFGKTMKLQIGKNEDNYIEGIIGKDFYTYRFSYNSVGLNYTQFSSTSSKNFWEKYEKHLVAYALPEDIIKKDYQKTVEAKVWIDNQLLETLTFRFSDTKLY